MVAGGRDVATEGLAGSAQSNPLRPTLFLVLFLGVTPAFASEAQEGRSVLVAADQSINCPQQDSQEQDKIQVAPGRFRTA